MLVLVVLALGEFIDACEALAEFFAGLSVRSDVSFLILDSPACDPEDPLWRQLAVFGHLVALAVDGAALVPGCVLFVPRDHDVRLGDDVLHLHAAHEPNLDHLLIAASQRFTSDAVAILGPGVDGARGARAIRAAGGEVLHLRLQSANTEATRGCVPPPADSHDTPQALAEHLSARLRARQRSPAHTAKTLDDLERRVAALAATCAEFESRNAELAGSRDAEALLETSGVAGLLLDRQLKVRHYTSAFCECVPLTPDDVGRPLAELPCTFDRPRERLHFVAERTLRDGQVRVDQVQDRRGHLYLRRFAPLVAGDVVTGVALTLVDISGVAANEAARARRHADRLHQLMVHLPQGILSVLDEELVHREIYGKELARLNVPPRDILGHHLEEIYSAESAARIREHCERALTEKRLISFENSFGAQTYLVSALPIPAVDGDHNDLLVLSTNVTELRSAREALHAAKDAAERANSARLAFLASMSHELRTPLAGMLGLLEIIDRESDVGEASRLHLLRLRYLVDIQERLISDLLDLSRIDAQQLHLRIASFDVHQVLTELVADTFCSRDDLELSVSLPTPGATFVGDPLRICQIVDNLASNALKYTEEGKISLEVALDAEGALTIEVSDTGSGIATNDLPRIFEAFMRVGELRHTAAGFGLGLPLVKRLVEQMGGTLVVESAIDEGSTFSVRLPPGARSDELDLPSEEETADALTGRHILIIDDNDVIRLVVGELLRRDGVDVTEAEDAASAECILATRDFDALIVDIGLPDRNGYDLIRTIREAEVTRPRVPIIALTAYAYAEDRARSLAAGADAHLAKPVSHTTLRAALGRLLVHSSSET